MIFSGIHINAARVLDQAALQSMRQDSLSRNHLLRSRIYLDENIRDQGKRTDMDKVDPKKARSRISQEESGSQKMENELIRSIHKEIERKKYFPQQAEALGFEDIVILNATLNPDGSIKNISYQKKSVFGPFNAAAMDILSSVSPLEHILTKKLPKSIEIRVPIHFKKNSD